ncbi:MAG TPA: endonuclease/exonuclease/phosphatase family protein [Mucilaginibacter sp.]|jgi:endonuclease/exonuclease/phosphatase family metal-dependent hydrolase|nr:endonuclease/exonuclease/phosphatase family protein [Mucilaginibacter sp.]
MEQIRIVTINTWKCDGNYAKRLALLAAQLQQLSPGVIACQECFSSDEANADTLSFLSDELNMQSFFLPGRSRKRLFNGNWVQSFSGLGILSAYPLGELENYTLPEVPGDDPRKLQLAEIALPNGGKMLIANTHLTHLRNTELRKEQAVFVADKVSDFEEYRYKIICGDLNADPGSMEIKALVSRAKAVDCYTAGRGGEPRYSLAEAYDRGIMICVDHIFALPYPGTNTYPDFVNSSIVLNSKDHESGIYPSDHFGISTTLVID